MIIIVSTTHSFPKVTHLSFIVLNVFSSLLKKITRFGCQLPKHRLPPLFVFTMFRNRVDRYCTQKSCIKIIFLQELGLQQNARTGRLIVVFQFVKTNSRLFSKSPTSSGTSHYLCSNGKLYFLRFSLKACWKLIITHT